MSIKSTTYSLIPIRRDGQVPITSAVSSGGAGSSSSGGGSSTGGGTTYTGSLSILVSGTTISAIFGTGSTTIACGSHLHTGIYLPVNNPIATGTLCAPVIIGTTCVRSPILSGTTCMKAPITCSTTCSVTPISCSTTRSISPIVSGSTCVSAPLVCATTKVCSPFLAATTCASSPIFNGTNYILTPTLSANTNIFIAATTNSAITNYGGLLKNNYVSQLTGYRISTAGEADFRYLYADELHVKSFIADLEQALAGGQIITKSVAKVVTDFTLPAAGSSGTLVVEEFAGFTGAVFVNGDVIRLRQFSRANNTTLNVSDGWGTVTYVSRDATANPSTQSYTFVRSSAPNSGAGSGVIKTGTLALDYGTAGQGLVETTTVDGINGSNSPYTQILTWTGHPATGLSLKMRSGNLSGVTDSLFGGALSGYGLYANNVYLTGCVVLPSAGITNDGSSASCVRFYAGCDYAHRTTAPFMITQDGSLTATGVACIGTSALSYGGGNPYNIAIKGSQIYETGWNGDNSLLYINQVGYQGGTTKLRATAIGNGKDSFLAYFQDSCIDLYKDTVLHGNLLLTNICTCGTNITTSTICGCSTINATGAICGCSTITATCGITGAGICSTSTINSSSTMTATNFILSSDERLKMNIQQINIKPVNVDYKEFELCNDIGQKRFGVIANELQKTNPELVRTGEDGMLSVSYFDLYAKEISALKCQVKLLRKDLNNMRYQTNSGL